MSRKIRFSREDAVFTLFLGLRLPSRMPWPPLGKEFRIRSDTPYPTGGGSSCQGWVPRATPRDSRRLVRSGISLFRGKGRGNPRSVSGNRLRPNPCSRTSRPGRPEGVGSEGLWGRAAGLERRCRDPQPLQRIPSSSGRRALPPLEPECLSLFSWPWESPKGRAVSDELAAHCNCDESAAGGCMGSS